MTLLQTAEIEANLLRRCLQTPTPEHRVLCILRFFSRLRELLTQSPFPTLVEGYLREFMPALVDAARRADPHDLLSNEQEQLDALWGLLGPDAGTLVAPDDLEALVSYRDQSRDPGWQTPPPASKTETILAALLVEEVPELQLPPRGRLLWLSIRASEADIGDDRDIIHIFNPHSYDSGPLVQQAGIAVGAARSYLREHYGLPLDKRYRLDFRVLPVTSHLTGNSLGIACAVGTVIAIARRETLRDSLECSPLRRVAFTGAVGADGSLEPIDGEGLRLKIERAYHNRLNYMAVPRAHLPEAYEAVRELEKQRPDHTLNVVGADTIDAILDDRNLINRRRRSAAGFAASKTRTALNKPRVGLPILLSLLLILAIIGRPWLVSRLDNNPATVVIKGKGILVKNQHGRTLWGKEYACDSLDNESGCWKLRDIDEDAKAEVIMQPTTNAGAPDNAKLFVYSSDGTLRFERRCAISNQYPGDDAPKVSYDGGAPSVAVIQGKPIIITQIFASNPSRGHIRMWTANGDSLGWYVNAGTCQFNFSRDFDGDSIEDLFFTGCDIRMQAAALFVIPGRGSSGCAPPYDDPQYDLHHVIRGNQLSYVILPRTDLSVADTALYNRPDYLRTESAQMFRLDVFEGPIGADCCAVNYYLDRRFRVSRVDIDDAFKSRRLKAVADGRLPAVDWVEYFDHLRDTVAYWTPGGWVSEGQMRNPK
jgi:hypothetical protein